MSEDTYLKTVNSVGASAAAGIGALALGIVFPFSLLVTIPAGLGMRKLTEHACKGEDGHTDVNGPCPL